jgi:hypothetical protein
VQTGITAELISSAILRLKQTACFKRFAYVGEIAEQEALSASWAAALRRHRQTCDQVSVSCNSIHGLCCIILR